MKESIFIKFMINLITRMVGIIIGMFVCVGCGILSFTSDIGLLMGLVSIGGLIFAVFSALYQPED